MKEKIRKNIITIAGISVGILGGFLYWKFVGCDSGTCPITSSWKIMLVYGGIAGGLLGNLVQDRIGKSKIKNAN
jgi:outer membrane lipoprotein SlyB